MLTEKKSQNLQQKTLESPFRNPLFGSVDHLARFFPNNCRLNYYYFNTEPNEKIVESIHRKLQSTSPVISFILCEQNI